MTSEVAPRFRPSKWRVAADALKVSLAAGVAIGAGLSIWIAVLNGWGVGVDALLLMLHLSALYSLVNAVGLGLVALAALALGRRPGPREFAATLLAFYLVLNGAQRFSQVIQLFSVTPHMNLVGIVDAVVVGLAALAAGWAMVARGRYATAAGLGPGRGTLGRTRRAQHASRAAAASRPGRRRPSRADQCAVPAARSSRGAARGRSSRGPRVRRALVGGPPAVAAARRAPQSQRVARGCSVRIPGDTPVQLLARRLETVVTSQLPARHGIAYHQHFEFAGVGERVRFLPNHDLCQSVMGLRRLLARADALAPWDQIHANATDARVARLWEIVARNGKRVGVYGWMNSSPATPVDGFIHGYGVLEPLNYPPDLLDGLPPLPEPVGTASGPREGPEFIRGLASPERAHFDRFMRLALAYRPEVLLFYTHYGDTANHMNWKRETVGEGLFYLGLEHPEFQPGLATTTASRVLDEFVGDVLSRLPEEATLVIVSDHGFDFRGYEHDNAPPGVLIARGPGVQPGPFSGASLVDVTPTLLHALHLPVADDMEGDVLPIFLSGGPLDYPTDRVASYGPAAPAVIGGTPDPDALRRHEEYLRALGYVN